MILCPDFEVQLDNKPANFTLRLVYSDWLEEHGETSFANTQRWMAGKCLRPCCTTEQRFWLWGNAGSGLRSYSSCQLPRDLFDKVKMLEVVCRRYSTVGLSHFKNTHWRWYDTRHKAELALHNALQED